MPVLIAEAVDETFTDGHIVGRAVEDRTTRWQAVQGHRTVQQDRDDGLSVAAMEILRSSRYLALRSLKCEARDAVVAVHGVLPSYYLKQMAQSAIQRLEGIRGITNLVVVQGARSV
jgi:hypothetical protein